MRNIITTEVFANALDKLTDGDKIPVRKGNKIIAYVKKKDFIIDKDKVSMTVKFSAPIEYKNNEPHRVNVNLQGAVIEMTFDKTDKIDESNILDINIAEKIYTCNHCGNSGTAKKMVSLGTLIKCSRCGIIIGDTVTSAEPNKKQESF